MLILDEVTSSLDPESEAQIMTTLQSLKGKTTILIITHREASARAADSVYRLDNGQVKIDPAMSMPGEKESAVL